MEKTKKDSIDIQSSTPKKTRNRAVVTLVICALLAGSITYVLYIYTQNLLEERLKERIVAIVSTAATQINANDIEAIQTYDDLDKSEAKKIAKQLQDIRDANENIRYAYILRKTEDPNALAFVMDAETLDTHEEQEERAGIALEEDELAPGPGDPLEIDEYPALRDEAFFHPSSEDKLQKDQWSVQLSAYAPIYGYNQDVVAVIGIDVIVDDYLARIRSTLLPFLLFILFLILLLSFLSLLLIRYSGERVIFLEDLDRQKDELLGIVAHQLAKPITAIRWDLESLLDGDLGKLNAEQAEEAKTMKAQAVNLADLVSMILDVSRIQLGKMNFDPQPLDLNSFFKEIFEVIAPTVAQKNIHLVKNMPKTLPTVLLDKRYTRMTIENLLTNAVKYTPDGGTVTLDLSLQNGVMRCSVKDTGCGIPEGDKDKIFGKMYRATNVRNTVEGNGFGLFVAKGAIEGQRGKIWFTSEVGKGTTFFIELPMKEVI